MSAAATTVSSTLLKSVPLFAGLPNEQLRALASVVMHRSVPRASTIMAAGDAIDSLYIVISGRLKVMMGEANGKIGSLAMLDVYGRVARLLLDMSETVNGQKVVINRVSKQDIAKMVGASREMVSRVMKDLQVSGYIEERGSTIVLRDTIPPPH